MAKVKTKSSKAGLKSSFKSPLLQRALLLLPFFFFCTVGSTYAVDVKLQWQKSGETDLAGYKIYYDTDPGAPYGPDPADYADEYSVDGGTTWNPVLGAPPIEVDKDVTEIMLRGLINTKIYYFALTAYRNGFPDSDYSAERSTFEIALPSLGFYVNSSNYDNYSVKGVAVTRPDDIIVKAGATPIGGPFSTNASGEWSDSCDFSFISQGPISLAAESQADGFTSLPVSGIYDRAPPSSEATSARQENEIIRVYWEANDATPGSGIKKTVLWYKRGSGGKWYAGLSAEMLTRGTFEFHPPPGDDDITYYFATRSEDNAGNAETDLDPVIAFNYTASNNPNNPTGIEGAGGCFIDTAAAD